MQLAGKLKELRGKKGQSLQAVADGVGVSKAHIWELERGTSKNPSLDLLKKLAEYFKVPIAFLYDDSFEPEQAPALQFFREFEGKLSEKDWDALRGVAEALKSKSDE
jgi:transcriptional regulator with XRE-family HTH domain